MRGARMPVAVWPSAFPLAITTERDQVLRRLYQLFGVIENDDVFYLFWCRFANASEQVEKRVAHGLSSLHFSNIYLATLKTSTPSNPPANGPS